MKSLLARWIGAAFIITAAWAAAAPSPNDGFSVDYHYAVRAIAIQADGKILVGGCYNHDSTDPQHRIVRYNIDGTTDTTFNGPGGWFGVRAIAVQSDGKILFTIDNNKTASYNRVIRLDTDGTIDSSFSTAYYLNQGKFSALAVQDDGGVLVGGNFTQLGGYSLPFLARLKPGGAADGSFLPKMGGVVEAIAVQPDGRIVVAGSFKTVAGVARKYIARLNADGSLDASFDPGAGPNVSIARIALQPDGKIVIGGLFTQVGTTACNHIARLNADGSLDTAFVTGAGFDDLLYGVEALALQPDGKILAAGNFTAYNGAARTRVARLNPDGSLDALFDAGAHVPMNACGLAVQYDGKILVGLGVPNSVSSLTGGLVRLNADGSPDATFDPGMGPVPGGIYGAAVQPDGKILVSRFFTTFNGVARNAIARLNTTGTIDTSFVPPGGYSTIESIAVQPDGKVLVRIYKDPASGYGTMRLNADGSQDPGFQMNYDIAGGAAMIVQRDGKIVVGGGMLRRLNTNGSFDAGFTPAIATSGVGFETLALQPDGKILVGGAFRDVNGVLRSRVARINANGTLDMTFNTSATTSIESIMVLPDGKILIGGVGQIMQGIYQAGIARLNADGSLDSMFIPHNAVPHTCSLALQGNGMLLIGGWVNPKIGSSYVNYHFGCLNDNALFSWGDDTFPDTSNSGWHGAMPQPDGKFLVCGDISTVDSITRNGVGRVTNQDAALQKLSVTYGGRVVTWTLGGSYPWPYQVLFEDSDDGETWQELGWGTAVAGVGYRLAGQSLPVQTNHYVRATGWVQGALKNNSTSLYRSVLRFYVEPYKNSSRNWEDYR